MKIAICEDQDEQAKQTKQIILTWAMHNNIEVDVKLFPNAESFILSWEKVAFDLLVLDIYMGEMSGLALAELVRQKDQDIMLAFVTSYSQHILDGYSVNAIQYLLKPISPLSFTPILDKALSRYREIKQPALIVQNDGALINLKPHRIHYIAMFSHEAKIHTYDKEFTTRKTISELMKLLPSCFATCHRSYIVNILKIESLQKNRLHLCNGVVLPVSRGHSKKISDLFIKMGME